MKYKTKRWIIRSRFNQLRYKLKLINWKGGQITLYEVLFVFFKKMRDDGIIERANAVAFSFTIALFPGVLFLFALIPIIHEFIPAVDEQGILDFIGEWMPENMYSVVESTIIDIVGKSRGGLITFGAAFALFLASNGIVSLMNAFNAIYQTKENRSFIKQRAIATALTLMLSGVMMFSIILLVVGQILLGLIADLVIDINELGIDINQVLILRFAVLFIVFLIAISSIYYFAPAVHFKWQFFSLGSLISTLLSLIISYVFSFYVGNFGTYNKLYGSIGVMLAIMIWLFLFSVVLLVGYVINASIHTVQHTHRIEAMKHFKLPGKLVN